MPIFSRVNEPTKEKSRYFVVQRRRGHGASRGLSSIIIGTLDSVFDKPAPFRILHQTPSSEVFYGESLCDIVSVSYSSVLPIEIACDLTLEGIMKDWNWLVANLLRVLNEMETDDEVTNFTICKVESLITQSRLAASGAEEEPVASASDQVVMSKFKDIFKLPDAERLVNYYSCK